MDIIAINMQCRYGLLGYDIRLITRMNCVCIALALSKMLVVRFVVAAEKRLVTL